jgi:hypothetical protein
MLYLFAKLFHVMGGGIILGGIIASLMKKIPKEFQLYLVTYLIFPFTIIQLVSGLILADIANFDIFDNLWIHISFYLLILLIAINFVIMRIYKVNKNNKYLGLLRIVTLVIVLVAFYAMVFQPEIT